MTVNQPVVVGFDDTEHSHKAVEYAVAEAFLRPGTLPAREAIERVANALAEKLELAGTEIDLMMPPTWIARQIGKPCSGNPASARVGVRSEIGRRESLAW